MVVMNGDYSKSMGTESTLCVPYLWVNISGYLSIVPEMCCGYLYVVLHCGTPLWVLLHKTHCG